MSKTFTIDPKFRDNLSPQTIRFVASKKNVTLEIEIIIQSDHLNELPDIGSQYKGTIPNVYGISSVALSSIEINSIGKDDEFFKCRLTYSHDVSYDTISTGVRTVYELNTEDIDVPIEQHSKYRMCWNHLLLARDGVTQIPAFWETATNSLGTGANYQWASAGDTIPDGWYVLKAEKKPGVSSFKSGVPTVTQTKVSNDRSYLSSEAKSSDYTKKSPGNTFGYSGSWLRCGSSIRYNGKQWELQTRFINSKTIDSDLYN